MSAMISLTAQKTNASSNVSVNVNNNINAENPYEKIILSTDTDKNPLTNEELHNRCEELKRMLKAENIVLKCYAERRYTERWGKVILDCCDLINVFNEYLGIDNTRIDCDSDSVGCLTSSLFKIDGIITEGDDCVNNLKYARPDIFEWLRQLNISTKYVLISNKQHEV